MPKKEKHYEEGKIESLLVGGSHLHVLAKEKLAQKNVEFDLEKLMSELSGVWNFHSQHSSVYRYRVDQLSGGGVFVDRDWIGSGNGVFTNINFNRTHQTSWYLEYNQRNDSLRWSVGAETQVFSNVSDESSYVRVLFDVPNGRIMIAAKIEFNFGNSLVMKPGSYFEYESNS